MKFLLGKTLLPSVPVAFIDELGAAITVKLDDIGLGWEDSSPVLGQGSGAVSDKSRRYLNWLDLSTCQVEEFCSNSNEGMGERYCTSEVGKRRNDVFGPAV